MPQQLTLHANKECSDIALLNDLLIMGKAELHDYIKQAAELILDSSNEVSEVYVTHNETIIVTVSMDGTAMTINFEA